MRLAVILSVANREATLKASLRGRLLLAAAAKDLLLLGTVLAAACVDQPVVPNARIPTLDDPLPGAFVAVSAGQEHTCGLITDGSAYCWGSNEFGQLGAASDTTCLRDDRVIACQLRPLAVTGGLKFLQIAAGGRHTCGLAINGRIHCWGDNLRGGLGDPAVRDSPTPIPVATTATFTSVVVGRQHSCGLRADGFAMCWGANEIGQLGNNVVGLGSATPDSVRTTVRFASIAAGALRTCGRTGNGATFCWGSTWVTTLNGSDVTRAQGIPQVLATAPPLRTLAVGTTTTCGIANQSASSADNAAFCWEGNLTGAIGDGTAAGSLDPRAVRGGIRFVAISVGEFHTCGIADDGLAYCWGGGPAGQLGVSTFFLNSRCGSSAMLCSTIPLRVSGWRTFSQISAGQGSHVCGLTLPGNVYCWGASSMGQRGDGRALFGDWAPVQTVAP
jgi:alpha-tubulin suppressor-like RCC1 family protein